MSEKINVPRIAITHGDINGIGYEVIIKTLLDTRILEMCTPVVYGSPKIAAYHRKTMNITNFSFNNVKSPEEANAKRANIINCVDENTRVELGKSTQAAGESSVLALEKAVEDIKNKHFDILITAPINKKNIQSESFKFAGHTEYLIQNFGIGKKGMMLMVSNNLRIGVATGHIPIQKVSESITIRLLIEKLRIFNKALLEDFAITKPRIAVLGLNPHAGDEGVIGKEEADVIIPAIEKARDEGIMALGPYPADGFFGTNGFQKFDGVLAMYHDQGLIPFKTISFDDGVNFTAGLSIVRTSPAHGTAYEIAGTNVASENSFRNALYLACDIYTNRLNYKEMARNPLKQVVLDTDNIVDDIIPLVDDSDAI